MSDPLTDAAPVEPPAVVVAPVETPAVEDSSGGGEAPKVIPVERFNGLMSTFNKTQAELDAERQKNLDLEDRLREFETRNINDADTTEEFVSNDEIARLNEQVNLLTQMLVSKEVEGVKGQLINEYPDIAPFADLIEGSDPAAMRALAEQLNERVQVFKTVNGEPPSAPPVTPEAPEAPAAPVVEANPEAPVFGGGSGQVQPGGADIETRISEAIAKRDFGAFMRAKNEQAMEPDLVL